MAGGARWSLSADSSKAVKGTKEAADGFAKLEGSQKKALTTGQQLSVAMAGVNQALELGKKVINALGTAYDATLGKLDRLASQVAEMGDSVAKTSRSLHMNAQELQAWRAAAGYAGINARQLDKSLLRIGKSALDADRGLSTAVELFGRAGIEVHDTNGELKTSAGLMTELADAFKADLIPDTEKAALASQLLGDRTGYMASLLAQGSDAVEDAREEMERYGALMSDELLGMTEEYIDSNQRLDTAMQGWRNEIAEQALPALTDLKNRLAEALGSMKLARGELARMVDADGPIMKAVEGFIWFGLEADIAFNKVALGIAKTNRDWLKMLNQVSGWQNAWLVDQYNATEMNIRRLSNRIAEAKRAQGIFMAGGVGGLPGVGGGPGGEEPPAAPPPGEGPANEIIVVQDGTEIILEKTRDMATEWANVAGNMGTAASGLETMLGAEVKVLQVLGGIVQKVQAFIAVIQAIKSVGSFFGGMSGVVPVGGLADAGRWPLRIADRGFMPGHTMTVLRNDETVIDPVGTRPLARMFRWFEQHVTRPSGEMAPAGGMGRTVRVMFDAPILLRGEEVGRLVLDEIVETTRGGRGGLAGGALEFGR